MVTKRDAQCVSLVISERIKLDSPSKLITQDLRYLEMDISIRTQDPSEVSLHGQIDNLLDGLFVTVECRFEIDLQDWQICGANLR